MLLIHTKDTTSKCKLFSIRLPCHCSQNVGFRVSLGDSTIQCLDSFGHTIRMIQIPNKNIAITIRRQLSFHVSVAIHLPSHVISYQIIIHWRMGYALDSLFVAIQSDNLGDILDQDQANDIFTIIPYIYIYEPFVHFLPIQSYYLL